MYWCGLCAYSGIDIIAMVPGLSILETDRFIAR